jgi:hypothetical protein
VTRRRFAVDNIPPKVGPATEEGINDAIDAVVSEQERAEVVAGLLEEDPRMAIRRALELNSYQRAALVEMTDDEVGELVSPVVEALRSDDPQNFRVRLDERVETESPLRIRCRLEVDFP